MERPKTFKQFMEKFGGKEASEFEEILKNIYGTDLNDKYCCFLYDNFNNLQEEEKLKFTVEQAEKIKNDEFVKEKFCCITIAEMKINKGNTNEKLSELAKKIYSKDDHVYYLNDFLIYYFSNPDSDLVSKFHFSNFAEEEIEFLIKYKKFFPFINDLLKQKYADFKCEDFLLEIEKNPQNVFDYLMEKLGKKKDRNCKLMIYLYLHIKFEEQTPERFEKLSIAEKHSLIFFKV